MTDTTLEELNRHVAACDAHHHFYHYKSSWLHLCLGESLYAQNDLEGARKHFKAALFQDHLNPFAKPGWESRAPGEGVAYDSHITSGAIDALAKYEHSLGWEQDSSMELCARGEFAEAVMVSGARHDRYHRHASDMHLRRGQYFLETGETELAIADFSKALDLDRHNKKALEARMRIYEAKNNTKMAMDDRLRLESLG